MGRYQRFSDAGNLYARTPPGLDDSDSWAKGRLPPLPIETCSFPLHATTPTHNWSALLNRSCDIASQVLLPQDHLYMANFMAHQRDYVMAYVSTWDQVIFAPSEYLALRE